MSITNIERYMPRVVRPGVNERVATHFIMDADFAKLEGKLIARLVSRPHELQALRRRLEGMVKETTP